MNAKQLAAIERHGRQLLAIYPKAIIRDPVKLCKRLRQLEGRAHAIALRLCNGPEYPCPEHVDNATDAILAQVRAILVEGPGIFINRDPRGYALKIRQKESAKLAIEKDWGGYGIIAPEITGE